MGFAPILKKPSTAGKALVPLQMDEEQRLFSYSGSFHINDPAKVINCGKKMHSAITTTVPRIYQT